MMLHTLFSKTGVLTRFVLRRDIIRIAIWLLSFTILTVVVAYAFTDLYASESERQAIAETMKNPAMTALFGEGYGIDHYTTGAMMAHQMLLLTAIVVAIMNILFVTRHTRTSEEAGQIELIRALPTGRLSQLSATLLVSIMMNIILALLIGFGLYALQIDSLNLEGSLLYGIVLGVIGIFFASVTAIFAQLTESSRNSIGLAFAVLGGAYILRAIGDVGEEFLAWLSPLGWVLRTKAYVDNIWWPILLTIGVAVIFVGIAFYIHAVRDLGSGLFPAKRGRSRAHSFMLHPFGLAVKLQQTGIIAWLIGMAILGLTYGSVLGDLESFLSDSELMQQLLQSETGSSITSEYLTMILSVMSMMSVIPAVMVLLKLKKEEIANRTENILSRAVSRVKVFGSYVFLAYIVGLLTLLISAMGIWLAGSTVVEDMLTFGTVIQAALVYAPATWVMIGLAGLLTGYKPSWILITWVYLGYSFILSYFGGLMKFPSWMENISPFVHIPNVITDDMTYISIIVLTIIAILLTGIGFVSYKRRDLQG